MSAGLPTTSTHPRTTVRAFHLHIHIEIPFLLVRPLRRRANLVLVSFSDGLSSILPLHRMAFGTYGILW